MAANLQAVGGSKLINTATGSDQVAASVAHSTRLADGSMVVVWESDGQDISGFGVFGQVLSPELNKVGGFIN